MKTIKPITSWANGKTLIATLLRTRGTFDNMRNSAQFYYLLSSQKEDGTIDEKVAEGNLTISGDDYQKYDSNDYAKNWIATTLGLEITGDYIPPVIEQPQPLNP